MARRRRGTLSPEDAELWGRVAATAKPLRPAEPLAPPPLPTPPAPPEPAPDRLHAVHPAHPRRVLKPEGRPAPPVAWRLHPDADRPGAARPGAPGLDRNTARRLAEGRLTPQARLDLHGMTADAAHGALARFIAESSAHGRRCVLVITGKGRGESGGRGEGVLRRDVPRWLTVAPLAGRIVGVFEAHPRHGGGGALYVYIRRDR